MRMARRLKGSEDAKPSCDSYVWVCLGSVPDFSLEPSRSKRSIVGRLSFDDLSSGNATSLIRIQSRNLSQGLTTPSGSLSFSTIKVCRRSDANMCRTALVESVVQRFEVTTMPMAGSKDHKQSAYTIRDVANEGQQFPTVIPCAASTNGTTVHQKLHLYLLFQRSGYAEDKKA